MALMEQVREFVELWERVQQEMTEQDKYDLGDLVIMRAKILLERTEESGEWKDISARRLDIPLGPFYTFLLSEEIRSGVENYFRSEGWSSVHLYLSLDRELRLMLNREVR